MVRHSGLFCLFVLFRVTLIIFSYAACTQRDPRLLFGLFALQGKNCTKLWGNFLNINLSSFPFTRVSTKDSILEVEALSAFCTWLFFALYKQTYRSHAHLNRSGLRAGLSSQGLCYYMKIQFFIKLDFSQQLSFNTKEWKNSNFSGLLEW